MTNYSPLAELSKIFKANWNGRTAVTFSLPGYEIDFYFRSGRSLIVAFDHMQLSTRDPSLVPGWGYDFLKRKGVSAMHVKPSENCWYRKVELENFMRSARELGLFKKFEQVMTYGGSMGGFGALSFAGICNATSCLALNPQVKLGPSVRGWETRFKVADSQNWNSELSDINKQIASTGMVAVVYDPYFNLDRGHVDLIDENLITKLKIPFVGHEIPVHLVWMGVLDRLFDDVLAADLNLEKFYNLFKKRRILKRYKNKMLDRARGRLRSIKIIKSYLGDDLKGLD